MEGGAGEVGGNGDGYEPSALFKCIKRAKNKLLQSSTSSRKSENIWYSGNGPVPCRKDWPGSGGAAMKATFSLSPSVSFAWTCFAHLLWLSVGLSFLNQSLKSSGIRKPCFVSSERTVMCSKLGQAGAARSVLSSLCCS